MEHLVLVFCCRLCFSPYVMLLYFTIVIAMLSYFYIQNALLNSKFYLDLILCAQENNTKTRGNVVIGVMLDCFSELKVNVFIWPQDSAIDKNNLFELDIHLSHIMKLVHTQTKFNSSPENLLRIKKQHLTLWWKSQWLHFKT